MSTRRPDRLLTTLLLALIAVGVPGCFSSTSKTVYSGKYVGMETLGKIRPGMSRDEVRRLLGKPSAKEKLEENVAVWRWDYTRAETSKGSAFLVLRSSSERESEGSVYVRFEDGKVARTWHDEED